MSCNACTNTYGFWTKEAGCPNCGFSFCTKCLKKTIAIPRLNNAKHKVCLTCFDRIQKEQIRDKNIESMSIQVISSPLDEPIPADGKPPIPAFVQQAQENLPASTSDTDPSNLDEEIKKRLETLKQDRLTNRYPMTTDADIAIRIANLKGLDYNPASNSADRTLLLSTDQRTDQEKIQDLVKQFTAETNLDESADPIRDIEKRLAILKGTNVDGNTKIATEKTSDNEDDDETKVKKLVSKYLDEASLPVADGASSGPEQIALSPEEKEYLDSIDVTKQQEELPWCTICNEDADLRYDGDLFCKACYKEIKEDE